MREQALCASGLAVGLLLSSAWVSPRQSLMVSCLFIRMDAIKALRRVTVDNQNGIGFLMDEPAICAAIDNVIAIDECNSNATYDPVSNSWMAVWKWSEGKELNVLQNQVEASHTPHKAREVCEEELVNWMKSGCLLAYDKDKYRPAKGLIPLMAVVQHKK